jgi:hypothetical protein
LDKAVTLCIDRSAIPDHLKLHDCDCLGPCATPHPNKRESGADDDRGELSAHPNPFKDQTEIEFFVFENGRATVMLYDIHGALVAKLFDADVMGGELYSIPVASGLLPQGVYISTLVSGDIVRHHKLLIAR